MRRNAVVLSAIALLAGCSGGGGGGETTDEQIFELGEHLTESGPVGNSLRRVDPSTMLPTRALALGDYVNSRALSPDGRTMAFGAANDGRIVFVDLATMARRSVRITKAQYRSVWVLSWPTRRTLVAASCHDAGKFGCFETRLWRLDPTNPRERRSTALPALPQATYDAGTKRTFLLVRARRVLVVEPDGRLRSVALGHAATGLAVDTGRGEVIAVGPRVPVAAIDVRTLSVSYHRVRGGSKTRVFDVATGRLLAKIPPRTLAWDNEPPAFRWKASKD